MPADASSAVLPRRALKQDWETESWNLPYGWRIRLLQLAFRYRRWVWTLWWISAALLVLESGLLLATLPAGLDLLGWGLGAVPVWLAASFFLVRWSAWHGVRFRYLAWGAAVAWGGMVRMARTKARMLVLLTASLLLVAVGVLLVAGSGLSAQSAKASPALAPVGAGLLAVLCAGLLWSGYRARPRILIRTFDDRTGDPALAACAQGLSERLCGELAAIAFLYRTIAATQGRRHRSIYGAAIDVQDVGSVLQNAISSDTSIDLKFFKVPLAPLLSLGERLFPEGCLTGSLHHQSGSLLLIARLSGGGQDRNWRVETADLDPEERGGTVPQQLDRMVRQLAYRIATDLVATGSPKWRAVRSFTEGLSAYHEAQRTDIDKLPKLRRAERALLQALGEDQAFAQCHYNLGIVYRDMEERRAAEAAFRKALQHDTEPSQACYAIAVEHFQNKDFPDSLWHTKNGIRLRPSDMKTWHLRAVTLYLQNVQPLVDQGESAGRASWREVLETEEIAVALSWRDLCRSLARGEAREPGATSPAQDRIESTAAYSVSLAIAYVLRGLDRRAEFGRWSWWLRRFVHRGARLYCQASSLKPGDANIHFEWTRALFQLGDMPAAARAADRAFAGGLDVEERAELWSYVLALHAALYDASSAEVHRLTAEAAYGHLLDHLGAPIEKGDEEKETLEERILGRIGTAQAALGTTRRWTRRRSGALEDRAEPEHEHDLGLFRRLIPRPREAPQSHGERFRQLAAEVEDRELTDSCSRRLAGIILGLRAAERVHPDRWAAFVKRWDTFFASRREALEAAGRDEAGALSPLNGLLEDGLRDWDWVCANASLRLGEHLLDQRRPKEARECFQTAQERFRSVSRQNRLSSELGLSAKLAHASLLEADAERRNGKEEAAKALLRQSLQDAEEAVRLKPEGSFERHLLAQIYQAAGDYRRAEQEWETCRFLDPVPEVLSMAAESHWRRGLELAESGPRRDALAKATQVFEAALALHESRPQTSLEDRGKVHLWLGTAYRELLRFDEAILHYKLASNLGYRSLEARACLGWVHLEAGRYSEAERIFLEASREVSALPPASQAEPAGAMPREELVARVRLGWPFVYAQWGFRLPLAEKLTREALKCCRKVKERPRRRELLALGLECLGLIHQQRSDLAKANRYLRRAVRLQARSESYLLMAQVHLGLAQAQARTRTAELQYAQDACDRAVKLDVRGQRNGDITALRARIDKSLASWS